MLAITSMKASQVDLPSTLERSPAHAQHIYRQALAHASDEYGDGERAHRTAIAALKREFEKVGDHWAPKKRRGPSDPRAKSNVRFAGEDFGGVDFFGHTKQELYERARDLRIAGRSKMDKRQLARAIAKKQH
jgi:cation transport regulator ChaB